MKVVSCVNGHYYDADKYERCPTCGGEMAEGKQEGTAGGKPWWSGKGSGRGKSRKPPQPEPRPEPKPALKPEPQPEPQPEPKPEPRPENRTDGKGDTLGVFQDRKNQPAPQPAPQPEKQPEEKKEEGTALQNDLKKVTADNREVKTYGVFQQMMADPAQKSVPIDPVVGWLVCVRGMQLGASFALHAGKNTVGRDQDNDIVLDRDNSVSRRCHATVIFEPKKSLFYLQPGQSS